MTQNSPSPALNDEKQSLSWLKLFVIITIATTLGGAIVLWLASIFLFPNEFKPVTLNHAEEQILQTKLRSVEAKSRPARGEKSKKQTPGNDKVEAGPYSEAGARREITFTEREINALLAKNTDLAKKLKIDFSENLASARLIVHLDQDLPVMGGKTVKASAGIELSYTHGKPTVILKGISLWGVPIPNAWLGNLKNIDLVKKFGQENGFWKAFAAGVDDIRISEGSVRIKLKE
ncbi:MAG: arginine N-succinyltransferase [Deltaproteobacteria bacterium]|nr:arginine N-succinyltransferase [Deltaproteobacteria bacterium]